jgi:hypothetical protein
MRALGFAVIGPSLHLFLVTALVTRRADARAHPRYRTEGTTVATRAVPIRTVTARRRTLG